MPSTSNERSSPSTSGRQRLRIRAVILGSLVLVVVGVVVKKLVPYPLHAEIRLPSRDEVIPLDRFQTDGASNARSIATVTTCFTRSTWINTAVYAIENGDVRLIAEKTSGRSSKSSRPSDPYLMTLPVTFAMADAEFDGGHTTLLTMRGASRSLGNFGGIHQRFEPINSETFIGRIDPGQERLLYVEGNQHFNAAPTTTIETFAASNPTGYFLVVSIGFER